MVHLVYTLFPILDPIVNEFSCFSACSMCSRSSDSMVHSAVEPSMHYALLSALGPELGSSLITTDVGEDTNSSVDRLSRTLLS